MLRERRISAVQNGERRVQLLERRVDDGAHGAHERLRIPADEEALGDGRFVGGEEELRGFHWEWRGPGER